MTEDFNIEEKMKSLRVKYLKQLEERIIILEKCLNNTLEHKMTPKDWNELKFHSHKLSGNGAVFGFPEISRSARLLEIALSSPEFNNDSIIPLIKQIIKVCHNALKTTEQESQQSPKSQNQMSKNNLPLILVIDDDEQLWGVIRSLFKESARVVTCSNAEDGIRMMLSHKPDLVLLDDIMPGISGVEMLNQAQMIAEITNIPVIMTTVNNRPDQIMHGLNAGAIDYIIKPFEPNHLKERVRFHLSLKDEKSD